ncbi:MAG: capsular biosynthesis protein [Muribaculaceae bacterium]|nr:capsular biosynthesis protein [Muribaculaceae bacterium]
MWPFKSVASIKDSGMFQGFTDWHSHILPGVDDGVQSMQESLDILKLYEDFGVRRIWLTPHIMEDIPNQPAELKKKFEELKKAWDGKVELKLAAEHMLDSLFEERLASGDVLPIGDEGRHILVETSYYTPPMGMEDLLDKIKAKGYYPVLAHPERYRYMDEAFYNRLKNKGILFQMNYASLVGGYGESAKKKAEWLLKKDMVNLVGSDVHRMSSINPVVTQSPQKKQYLELIINAAKGRLE